MKKSKSQSYKINKGFIVQKMANKITIFDAEESLLYSFNEIASFIFSKIKSRWDKEKIARELIDRYNVRQDKAYEDLNALISDLLVKRVITQKPE